MPQAILFDLDGTLVDSVPDIAAAMNRSLRRAGLPTHPAERYRQMVGNGARILTERAAAGHPEAFERVYRMYRKDYALHLLRETRPYPGIPALLEALRARGKRLFVLSNKDEADVRKVLEGCFPGFRFDRVRGRLDAFPLKPDPASARDLLRLEGLLPRDVCVVGDSAVDIALAKALGAPSLGCAWGFRGAQELVEAKADHVAQNAGEALRLLLSDPV